MQKQDKNVHPFQIRSKTLNIKTYCPYRYKDLLCRKCEVEEETLKHVANCRNLDIVDTAILESGQELPKEAMMHILFVVARVEAFCEVTGIHI